jgi:hypothetical protein
MTNQMKNKKIFFIIILGLIVASGQICVVHSASSSDQDRALAFIENVLPMDISKFNIELKVDSNATDIPKELGTHSNFAKNDRVLIYYLGSMVGTADGLDVIFVIRGNTFFQGVVDIDHAPSYNEFGGSTKVDNIKNFLLNYQNWSGLDSTKMVEMLSNIDVAQDINVSLGDLTMAIQNTDVSNNLMEIRWANASHGTDLDFDVSFKKGFPVSFYDERQFLSSTPTSMPTINTGPEPPQTEPFSTTFAVASILLVAALVAGLLIYFMKRRQKATQV